MDMLRRPIIFDHTCFEFSIFSETHEERIALQDINSPKFESPQTPEYPVFEPSFAGCLKTAVDAAAPFEKIQPSEPVTVSRLQYFNPQCTLDQCVCSIRTVQGNPNPCGDYCPNLEVVDSLSPLSTASAENNKRHPKRDILSCTSCTESDECIACWFDNHEKAEDHGNGLAGGAMPKEAACRPMMNHYRTLATVLLKNGIQTRSVANLIFQFVFKCDPLSDWGEEIEAAAIAGMNLAVQTECNDTPLLLASQCGHVGAIQALVYFRTVNLERRDESGRTSLIWAAANGHYYALVALIAAGANVNSWDARGWTAIMFCARWGYDKCAKVLLDAKADVSLRNRLGDCAIDMARDQQSTQMYRILHSSTPKRGPPRAPTPDFQLDLFEPRGRKTPPRIPTQSPQNYKTVFGLLERSWV